MDRSSGTDKRKQEKQIISELATCLGHVAHGYPKTYHDVHDTGKTQLLYSENTKPIDKHMLWSSLIGMFASMGGKLLT